MDLVWSPVQYGTGLVFLDYGIYLIMKTESSVDNI